MNLELNFGWVIYNIVRNVTGFQVITWHQLKKKKKNTTGHFPKQINRKILLGSRPIS